MGTARALQGHCNPARARELVGRQVEEPVLELQPSSGPKLLKPASTALRNGTSNPVWRPAVWNHEWVVACVTTYSPGIRSIGVPITSRQRCMTLSVSTSSNQGGASPSPRLPVFVAYTVV